ncbi:A disintegrin and metalloproteinase with thrombospondin motifs 18-like [Clupea harengus]|uniref:A disintegrin and metalloproteinase with thrombospondin motifs 18-like n=1 Tax=Clupea harengus TaxID=7950 RepID=A0A6P8FR62_CLUHA|nr:A disintegrin and metalloproteinase with thrombospondin motifs 18-like [Clupea harengus]
MDTMDELHERFAHWLTQDMEAMQSLPSWSFGLVWKHLHFKHEKAWSGVQSRAPEGDSVWALWAQAVALGGIPVVALQGWRPVFARCARCALAASNCKRPQYNGKFCPGASRLYQLCNTKRCQAGAVDFRAQQCAQYNSKPFRGWYYKWKPYTKVEDEDICKLYCIAEDFDFFFAMASKVKDGTSCSGHRADVCIEDICESVGCDQVLGSKGLPGRLWHVQRGQLHLRLPQRAVHHTASRQR